MKTYTVEFWGFDLARVEIDPVSAAEPIREMVARGRGRVVNLFLTETQRLTYASHARQRLHIARTARRAWIGIRSLLSLFGGALDTI